MAYGDSTKTPFSPSTIKTTDTTKTPFSTSTAKTTDTTKTPDIDTTPTNPVIEVGMEATLQDGWYFADPQMEYVLPDLSNPYEGLYHLMQDGIYMIGVGALNASHEINPNEIIIQDDSSASTDVLDDEVDLEPELDLIEGEFTAITHETIQEVREIVSDLFYKLWFVEYTLTDEDVLSLQTTIRDGKKQTGRTESEPLVFYKKDRNTLENRQDLQGDEFELICQDIFVNEIPQGEIPNLFQIFKPPEAAYDNTEEPTLEPNFHWKLQKYIMRYTNEPASYDVVIAEKVILYEDVTYPPDDTDTGEGG